MFEKKNKTILFLSAIIVLLLIPSASALELDDNYIGDSIVADENSIYVSATGSDDGNGSSLNPYNSISQAIDIYDSSVNSNIYVYDGNYNISSKININKDVTIVGQSREGVVLNGNDKSSIFDISSKSNVVLSSLTFMNAYDASATQYTASAVYISNPTSVSIDNCIFKNNKNGTVGLFDYFATSVVNISNSIFSNNEKVLSTNGFGAAIYVNGKYTLNVANTTFENNLAVSSRDTWESAGGAVHLMSNAKLATFDNCKFINNTASTGSAISASSAGDIVIKNSEFYNNTATLASGALIEDKQSNSNKIYLNLSKNIIKDNHPDTIVTSGNVEVVNISANVRLEASDVSMLEGQDRVFNVRLVDIGGNPISDKLITVNLTNYYNQVTTFSDYTNSSGYVSFSLKNLKIGRYKTVSSFAGDAQYDAFSTTNSIKIASENDYGMIFEPEYVKMVEGESFEVTGIIVDCYGEPDTTFDGMVYEIRWVNNKGTISVINGNYHIDGSQFVFDLNRCHLVTQNNLYYVNFSTASEGYEVKGSVPVDLSMDMPPVDPDIEVIWVSEDGSDEIGDGSEANPLKTVQAGLYVNHILGGSKTIHIKEGIYNVSIYNLLDEVTIVGEGANTILSQDAGKLGMFAIDNGTSVSFVNLTFTNGFATPVPASLITATGLSLVRIDGCGFYDNHAIRGGAISIDDANVYITNSYFQDNSALLQASRGGAIWITSGVLSVINTLFKDNEATLGGAIYSGYDADTYILNSTFIGNTAIATSLAYGGGGAIFSESLVETVVENSTFIQNSAEISGGAIFVYGGILDVTGSYFEDNSVGFGTDKANTIHVMPFNAVDINVSHSIFFTDDDYNKVIFVNQYEDDNESSYAFDDNYWGGQSKGFVSVNVPVTRWVIIEASKDTDPVYMGDSVVITTKFISRDSNGTIYELEKAVHDLKLDLSPSIGEVSPSTIVISKNIANTTYYANEAGSEAINFTSDYARHYVYSFKVLSSSKIDITPNITIDAGKTTTITVEVPDDLENNLSIMVGNNPYSIKQDNGVASLVLNNVIPGNYNVTVTYPGDDKYKGFVNETSFSLAKDPSSLSINIDDITFGDVLFVNVNVTEGATGSVIVTINNKTYTINLVESKGNYTISNLEAGDYEAYANYTGDKYFDESTSNTTFSVNEIIPITTIYVSEVNGSDIEGNGSADNPYATIRKALDRNNALGGNKTIIVSEGNYVLNRYTLTDSVAIIAEGDVVISSNQNNHLYIGGDVDVVLEGLTFINGKGYTAGSIEMGSSADNSLKNLTITRCNFIDNEGPIGAVLSYANTKITETTFINNTATGTSGSVQAIVNIRDNTLDLSYSIFVDNKMASDLIVYSSVEGTANYNFISNNTQPTDDIVSEKLTKEKWVVIVPSINDTDVVLRHPYEVSVEFKSTADGSTFNDLEGNMPDLDVELTAEYGKLNETSLTIHENTASTLYNIYLLKDDVVDVYLSNQKITNLTIPVNIPEEDKIYVDNSGNDANNGSKDSPLQTLGAAIEMNKQMGGNNTIIINPGSYNESNLIINDIVTIIGDDNVTVKASSIVINAKTDITKVAFNQTEVKHTADDLTLRDISLINSPLTSAGDSLGIYDSEVTQKGISTSSNTVIENTKFANISSEALDIKNSADISSCEFINNTFAVDVSSGNLNIKDSKFKENTNEININGADSATIDGNVFDDDAVINTNADAAITNNHFGNGSTINIENADVNVKNNTKVKIKLNDGSLSNAVIKFLDGKIVKVNGGVVTLNATVTDDMGNIIDGGSIEFTSNGNLVGEANVSDGNAKFDSKFESGEYTISGASPNFPSSKIYSGLLRVDVINYWFIDDTGYETLEDAVQSAVDGDVIKGVPDTYLIEEIDVGHRYRPSEPWTITKNITITSLNDTPVTLIGDNGRIFYVDTGSNLTLKNLILKDSHKDGDVGYGGVVSVFLNAQFNADNCTFIDNSADQGGAIYATGGVCLTNSQFINNTAGLVGAAVFKDFTGDLIIENCSFINSFASSFGGAICLYGDEDTDNYIINSIFDSNTGFRGGAVYAGGANLTVINSNFTSNKALRVHEDYADEEAIGGAFYNYYANVEFHHSNFINNYAQDCGGAMELDNTVTSSSDYNNTNITIYFTGIDDCVFINNTADDGGAIYMGVSGTPFVLITNSLFESNTARYDSAAIGNVAGFLSLTNTTFRQNTAGLDNLIDIYGTDDLYNEYDAYIFVDNCTFEANNVNVDIYVENMYSFAEIFDSTFIGESTVLSNRGFTNVSSTVIKDSRNASKYVINNFGLLGLENNTFDNPIFSDFYISTQTYIVVLDNQTHRVASNSNYTLSLVILDDNENLIEGGELFFIVEGQEINATLSNHQYTAQYYVTEGLHLIDANCSDTGLINLTVKTATIVGVSAPAMNVSCDNITEGENAVVKVELPADAKGTVTVNVDGKTYNATLENGKATVEIPDLSVGEHALNVVYSGDENYPESSQIININVKEAAKNATINITADEVTEGENLTVNVTLPSDATGNVTVGNTTVPLMGGEASVVISDLKAGNYTIPVIYSGDEKYNPIKTSVNVTVNVDTTDIITAPDVTKYYKGSERFVVNLTDYQGNPLVNKTVTIAINGVEYTRNTDANGIASMALGLNSGVYNVTSSYGNLSADSTVTILATVNGTDIVKVFRNGTQYYATFRDSEGNYLKDGTTVRFNINGVMYDRQVSGNQGLARLNINLEQGEYVITAINPETGENAANNITVIPRIIENKDIVKYYRNETQYTVKVIGDDGKAVGAGVEVTFNINGVFYKRMTNESGIAKLNINLNPGDYIITAEYNGCMVSNNITVLPVLSAKDIQMHYRDGTQFEAKLVDGQGKSFENQNIVFNINGVFYDRSTDADGIARLNINLMPGEYIITSTYNGGSISNNITII